MTRLDVLRNALGTSLVVPQAGASFPLSGTQPLATFTDDMGKPGQHLLALINWGDGSPNSIGVITPAVTGAAGGTYTVYGAHTYTAPGLRPITIKIVIDGNFDGHQDQTLSPAPLVARFSTMTIQKPGELGSGSQATAGAVVRLVTGQQLGGPSLARFASLFATNPSLLSSLQLQFGVQAAFNSAVGIAVQITEVWQQFYHRTPTATELATWTHYLAQVGDREGLSIVVASSLEYFQRAGSNNDTWLTNLTKDYFNNQVSPGLASLIAYYKTLLDTGRASRATVAKALLSSSYGDASQIQYLYNVLLGTNATAAQLAMWEANRPRMTLEQIALQLVTTATFNKGFTTTGISLYEAGQSPPFAVVSLGFLTPPLITRGTFYCSRHMSSAAASRERVCANSRCLLFAASTCPAASSSVPGPPHRALLRHARRIARLLHQRHVRLDPPRLHLPELLPVVEAFVHPSSSPSAWSRRHEGLAGGPDR